MNPEINTEVELKLAIADGAMAALRRDPLIARPLSHGSARLLNQYFDTPGLILRRRGIALRIRKSGRIWLQTVKLTGTVEGGLSTRPEWEQRFAGHFDFSAIDDVALRRLLEREQPHLAVVFATDFRRETWVVEAAPGCCIEVALDRGTIRAGDAVLPLAELELESKSATPAQLLAFGCALAQRHALFADERSKAARGYALFSGEPALSPRHASQPALAADLSCREAFCTIARECLAQIAANLLGALDSDDPEYAHQLRVGVRRLRSAIKLFEPLLPEGFASTWQAQLRTLAALAGEAREWDVLLSEILAPVGRLAPDYPGLDELLAAARVRRDAARETMRAELRRPACAALVISLMREIHMLATSPGNARSLAEPQAEAQAEKSSDQGSDRQPEPPEPRLADFAAARLQRLGRRAAQAAAAARKGEVARLHALRLRLKRLRYATEFLGQLLRVPDALGLRKIVALQTSLGLLNDLSVSGPLMEALARAHPHTRAAIAFVGGHHLAAWHDRAVPDTIRAIRWKSLGRDWQPKRKP